MSAWLAFGGMLILAIAILGSTWLGARAGRKAKERGEREQRRRANRSDEA